MFSQPEGGLEVNTDNIGSQAEMTALRPYQQVVHKKPRSLSRLAPYLSRTGSPKPSRTIHGREIGEIEINESKVMRNAYNLSREVKLNADRIDCTCDKCLPYAYQHRHHTLDLSKMERNRYDYRTVAAPVFLDANTKLCTSHEHVSFSYEQ